MRWGWMIVVVALLVSCQRVQQVFQTESIGKPYEVLVVGEDSTAVELVRQALQVPVAGLPQEEPAFDVSTVNAEGLNATLRMMRSIVVVRIDRRGDGQTHIRTQQDADATPQIRVVVDAPSLQTLKRDLSEKGERLRGVLEENELRIAGELLKTHHNPEAERTVRDMFGLQMAIPASMTSSKRGNKFLWLSNNSADAMQNICVYLCERVPFVDAVDWRAFRDSVMKENIPGEEPGMYMQTAVEQYHSRHLHGRLEHRGLWEMRGDMMGGPFVSVVIPDTLRRRCIVAEAFVYAPAHTKRNLLRQLEASLRSASVIQESKTTK